MEGGSYSKDSQGYYGRSVTGGPAPSAATTAATTPQHRPGTPNTDNLNTHRNPFGDGHESQSSIRSNNLNNNPFASPDASRPASSYGSSSARDTGRFDGGQRYFHSRRVRKEDVEKPWLAKKDPKEKWVTILPLVGILIGLGISGFLVWDGYRSVIQNKYCMVLDEDFSQGLRSSVWTKEVEVGGYG